jgi:hypothetical protein
MRRRLSGTLRLRGGNTTPVNFRSNLVQNHLDNHQKAIEAVELTRIQVIKLVSSFRTLNPLRTLFILTTHMVDLEHHVTGLAAEH